MVTIILFLALSLCVQCYEVDGERPHHPNKQNIYRLHDYKHIKRSIDDDFDCVDIYKQPFIHHPLLKNHKIQLFPTFMSTTMENISSYLRKEIKDKNLIKGCRPGKVPIFRATMRQNMITKSSSKSQLGDFNQYSQSYPGYHSATLDTTKKMTFHGASARIGAYNLSLQANQYSTSGIWIQNGPPAELNGIQVGIGVHPNLYGDQELHLTAHWTVDDYQKTGCFNNLCPGFVQVDPIDGLGLVIHGTNVIGSLDKYLYYVKVKQDQSTGHWWLIVGAGRTPIGYWPKEIFTHLNQGSSLIKYGGETLSPPNMISPPMGSGRLPKELFKNSGFIANLEIIDSNYNEVEVKSNDMKSNCDTTSNCYDLLYHGYEGPAFKQAFLFGGPGGNCGI